MEYCWPAQPCEDCHVTTQEEPDQFPAPRGVASIPKPHKPVTDLLPKCPILQAILGHTFRPSTVGAEAGGKSRLSTK